MRVSAAAGKVGVAALASLDSLNERYGLISSETLLSVAAVPSAKVAPGSPRSNWESASRLSRWHRLAVASRTDPQAIADDYEALTSVEAAQPNYLIPIAAGPDDPLFAAQWNLDDLGYGPGSEIGYSRDDRATVLVGLVDSGLDYTHPDIVDHIWTNSTELSGRDDVDDDGNGYVDDIIGWDFADAPTLPGEGDYLDADADPMDESGHGTHVGGIIAAGVNNGIGIAGVSSGAQLMVLRAAVTVGGASFLENDAIAAAIIYAVDNGAQILNFSFGSPQLSPLIRDAVRYAADAGVVLVAAVGNEGDENVFYPARHSECIAVAASDINGRIMAFSNHGSSVDVAAPRRSYSQPGSGRAVHSALRNIHVRRPCLGAGSGMVVSFSPPDCAADSRRDCRLVARCRARWLGRSLGSRDRQGSGSVCPGTIRRSVVDRREFHICPARVGGAPDWQRANHLRR